MDRVLLEIRQQNRHVLEMLRHMHEQTMNKLNAIQKTVGVEEEELKAELALQEHWFHQLAFQAAKIYGEEHTLTKHYRETYKVQTGKDWDPYEHKDKKE